MVWHRTNTSAAILLGVACIFFSFHSAAATILDFNGLSAGTVVAGTAPSGGTMPGDSFAEITLSCVNNGCGPNSVVVFDSQAPTGGDPDLGTPNKDFGGPGIGVGGECGAPGENNRTYGNLLIISEDLRDRNGDGLVDDPDDEAGGGVFMFDFDSAVSVLNVVLVDVDCDEWAEIRLYDEGGLIAKESALALGDNSVQTVDCSEHTGIIRMEIEISSSGAVAEIEYILDASPVEYTSWGSVKANYLR
jgi:hypothetical protein